MTPVTDVVVIGAGQSGLAAARTLQAHGISPVVLEAGPEPAGSWPHYYDSLTLFSPACYSAVPGLEFPGDPDRYPHRDEVVAYLRRYAATLGTDIRTSAPVTAVEPGGQGRFLVHTATGFDLLPLEWLVHYFGDRWVLDTGKYRHAFEAGLLDRRPMFTAFDTDRVVWADGTREHVDTVLFATGYRPSLDYLRPLGALDSHGMPRHSGGISATHPGLVYLGLEDQRSFSSNTLRGVHRDAEHLIPPLTAHVRNAPAAVGL